MKRIFRLFRRWPKGGVLRGFFAFDDRKTTVAIRYTGRV